MKAVADEGQAMANRMPTGPGSRGGRWHDKEYRRAYHRAWRAANPDYREREKLRRARKRAERNGDPATAAVSTTSSCRPLPLPAVTCGCADCGCREEVVVACGFCRDGLHREARSA
jgi:hypothetical protein